MSVASRLVVAGWSAPPVWPLEPSKRETRIASCCLKNGSEPAIKKGPGQHASDRPGAQRWLGRFAQDATDTTFKAKTLLPKTIVQVSASIGADNREQK